MLIALLVGGCVGHVSLEVTAPDGTVVKYYRSGNQNVGLLRYNPVTHEIVLEQQRADNSKLHEAVKILADKIPSPSL
jgi:hypothetical protein